MMNKISFETIDQLLNVDKNRFYDDNNLLKRIDIKNTQATCNLHYSVKESMKAVRSTVSRVMLTTVGSLPGTPKKQVTTGKLKKL
jgi:hypothetical protein